MTNVSYAKFGNSLTEKLIGDLRALIKEPRFDEIKICELLGILRMLEAEFLGRNE